MFGYRARVGYTTPIPMVETFPYEFYRMVPEGVTLQVATIPRSVPDPNDLEQTFMFSEAVAREMAEGGVNVIVVGGASPGARFGADRLEESNRAIEKEFGIPVTTALEAQIHALRQVGAKKLGIVSPFAASPTSDFDRWVKLGFEVVGVGGYGCRQVDFGRVPLDAPAQVGRQVAKDYPEVDTLFYPAAHWPAASNIETLEKELGKNVITSCQAIVWEALRRSKIDDRIQGYGRLLRDF